MKNLKLLALIFFFCAGIGTAHSQEVNNDSGPTLNQINKPTPIVANELREIGLWGLGIESKDFSPLNSDLWANARAENLGVLFDKTSANTKFASLNSLVQRVLFSGGIAPIASNEIAKKRLLAAARIGGSEKVAQLLSIVPQLSESQYLTAHYAESLFALGKNDEACALLNDNKPQTPVRIILELRAVCYGLNDEGAAAQLSLDLASAGSVKSSNDQWLARAIIALPQVETPNTLKYRADNGHFLAISNQLKLDIKSINPQNIASLNIVALSRAPIANQELVQRNAAKLGLLSFDEYRQLRNDNISAASPSINVNINPSGDLSLTSFEGEDFANELRGIADIDDWWVIAKRIGPKLKEIQNPNPKNIEVLIDAALANFDIETARRFMASAGQTPPYRNVILAIIDANLSPIIIRDTLNGTFITSYPKAKAIADLSMLWALGDSNNGEETLLEGANAGGTNLNQNLMMALESALQRKSKAEIVLTASLALQSIDAKAVDLSQMARIVKALKAVGFDAEAKELAIYSILARRIDFNRGSAAAPSPASSRTSNPTSTSNAPVAAQSQSIRQTPSAPKAKAPPPRAPSNIPDWRGSID